MICHHYKCVFVHIPKCAGQSIEWIFLRLLDLNWQTRAPLLLRANDRPELGPPRLAHLKAREYVSKKYMTQKQFDDYYCFAFVRNPWDRAVSLYKYLGNPLKQSFETFLRRTLKKELWQYKQWFVGPQVDFIKDQYGESLVDFVGRFECLNDDFKHVCHQLALPPIKIQHRNKSHVARTQDNSIAEKFLKHSRWPRKQRNVTGFSHYRDYYNEASINIVAELYERDIEQFKYEF